MVVIPKLFELKQCKSVPFSNSNQESIWLVEVRNKRFPLSFHWLVNFHVVVLGRFVRLAFLRTLAGILECEGFLWRLCLCWYNEWCNHCDNVHGWNTLHYGVACEAVGKKITLTVYLFRSFCRLLPEKLVVFLDTSLHSQFKDNLKKWIFTAAFLANILAVILASAYQPPWSLIIRAAFSPWSYKWRTFPWNPRAWAQQQRIIAAKPIRCNN